MPKVSVIIPSHNRPMMLKRAINSVLAQTYQDFEIIVVDDGVRERAHDAVKTFHDNRIRYISHEQERGAPVARNTGVKNSTGELVAFLDDDDEWLPQKLELQVEALDKHPEAGLCFCGVEAVNEGKKRLYFNIYNKEGLVDPHFEILDKSFVWTSSILVRKDILNRGFLFDESLVKNQEWDLTLRLSKEIKFYSINKALFKLHIHGNQLGGPNNLRNRIIGHHVFIQKHWTEYQKKPSSLSLRYAELGLLYKENKQYVKSLAYFVKAFITHPEIGYIRGFVSVLGGGSLKRALKKVYMKTTLAKHIKKTKTIASLRKIVILLYGDTEVARNIIRAVQAQDFMKNKFSFGHTGDFEVMMLYTIIRMSKPEIVVETGVASGRSSWAILQALKDNNYGKLYSIDLFEQFNGKEPEMFFMDTGRPEFKGFVPEGQMPGWLVPNILRSRWELIIGRSSEKLPELLEKLGSIDIFYHDSEHSYENMMFEFITAWPKIRQRGFLLSDDVKWNDAFTDFANKNDIKDYSLSSGFGLIRKTF